ncbi:MAG: alpha-glucan family phosphorylase [Thiobacillaceae bacterium]
MSGTVFALEVRPRLPEALAYLEIFANDLLYSWNRSLRGLYYRLDSELWEACRHNPKVFLRRVAQEKLDAAAQDATFLAHYQEIIKLYESYHQRGLDPHLPKELDSVEPLIAYFCAEYGFYESFPIYSGGLGILAGDHCKSASDLGLPFVAVGLLYRRGYFIQTIDQNGNQVASYPSNDFSDLPVSPALKPDGAEARVTVELVGRTIHARVLKTRIGRIQLYLLDTDLPENNEQDRSITQQLYGGDKSTRILQEIILGIGGVRALRVLGINPSVWHINEGHSAFMILERMREIVAAGRDFHTALEMVANCTVFTTHTPVPAGHDSFDHGLMDSHFSSMYSQLGTTHEEVLALGSYSPDQHEFNMTALALHGSRFHNGVSRIHGNVAAHMESAIWPQIPPEENPMRHVTNGVHVKSFLARQFVNLFDDVVADWRTRTCQPEFWDFIDAISDSKYWGIRQDIKLEMIEDVSRRTRMQLRRSGVSEARIAKMLQGLTQAGRDVLMIGFARRFATYKRANLLFQNLDRLIQIVNDPERPVMFLFAGKAHPKDGPGQDLIRRVWSLSQDPRLIGKVLLLEGYDMALARRLVSGVDVWLNTPEYPLEASGTSGMKAGLNGVPSLSVLDGWWGEGYDGKNGWGILPHSSDTDPVFRNQEEANDLLDIIEHRVVPLYYDRDERDYSSGWVRMSKNAMKSILPRFNAERMVRDYVLDFYLPALHQGRHLAENDGALARELASWKRKIRLCWASVKAERIGELPDAMYHDERLKIRLRVYLDGLDADDISVECQLGRCSNQDGIQTFELNARYVLTPEGNPVDGWQVYSLEITPSQPGLQHYRLRLYPYHIGIAHPYEMGYMCWL